MRRAELWLPCYPWREEQGVCDRLGLLSLVHCLGFWGCISASALSPDSFRVSHRKGQWCPWHKKAIGLAGWWQKCELGKAGIDQLKLATAAPNSQGLPGPLRVTFSAPATDAMPGALWVMAKNQIYRAEISTTHFVFNEVNRYHRNRGQGCRVMQKKKLQKCVREVHWPL